MRRVPLELENSFPQLLEFHLDSSTDCRASFFPPKNFLLTYFFDLKSKHTCLGTWRVQKTLEERETLQRSTKILRWPKRFYLRHTGIDEISIYILFSCVNLEASDRTQIQERRTCSETLLMGTYQRTGFFHIRAAKG